MAVGHNMDDMAEEESVEVTANAITAKSNVRGMSAEPGALTFELPSQCGTVHYDITVFIANPVQCNQFMTCEGLRGRTVISRY